jgi:hypothetical protein
MSLSINSVHDECHRDSKKRRTQGQTLPLGEKTSFSKSQQLHLTHSVNIKETVFLLRIIQFKFVTGGEWTQMWNGN